MAAHFHQLAFTDSVRKAQEHYYGKPRPVPETAGPDLLTQDELDFICARDSFYMATVSEAGWPYIQHRGGKPGFLREVGPNRLAFADYGGNRQMLSVGNLAVTNRVALFLMDYPRQTRLKLLGHVRVEEAKDQSELVARLTEPEMREKVERVMFIDVVAFDWNCQQHIVPRYVVEEVREAVLPLQQRIAELEAQLAQLGQSR